MKALSIQQPWAWAIIYAGKNIENRPRRTSHRGTFAVHASLQPRRDWKQWYPQRARKVPPIEEWALGAVIGFVDLDGVVEDHRSKWFGGDNFGYILTNPRPLRTPIFCKGTLGFWDVPRHILRRCRV